MKKTILSLSLIGLIFLSLGFFSCSKEEEKLNKKTNLSRDYYINNKKYTLTYDINKDDRVVVDKKTNDNLFIYEYFKSNPNSGICYNTLTNKSEIFKSYEDYNKHYLNDLPVSQNKKIHKAAKYGCTFKTYHHPNYNTLGNVSYVTHWTQAGNLAEQNRVRGVNGNSNAYGFAKQWVGSVLNDKISSLQVLQDLNSNSTNYNYLSVGIFQHANWSFHPSGSLGHWHVFRVNGTQAQFGCDNLNYWTMWSFFFYSYSWDDTISSYDGLYTN